MFVISQQTKDKYKFNFKVIGENERDIVPGRDYWARGYLSTWHSVGLQSGKKCVMDGNSVSIHDNAESVTRYKIEGEFTQEEIDVINAGIESGLEINFLNITLKNLGICGLKLIIASRKDSDVAA